MKLVLISDLHITAPAGTKLYGLDPRDRLRRCLEHVSKTHADADGVVLCGDLTESAELDAYRWLAAQLKELAMPVRLMIGNHDQRAPFQQAFPDSICSDTGFVQQVARVGPVTTVLLDSVHEGMHAGRLCEVRLEWIANRLDELRDERVWLFLHHPPIDIGIPAMDRIRLQDIEEFKQIVTGHSCVEQIFFGHIHRTMSGTWEGIPYSSVGSTNHHIAAVYDESEPLTFSHAPPSYAVVTTEANNICVHHEAFLDTSAFVRD